MANEQAIKKTSTRVIRDGAQVPTHNVSRVEMDWLRVFDRIAQKHKLGLYCSLCKSDIVAKNSDSDHLFALSCSCRDLVASNLVQVFN